MCELEHRDVQACGDAPKQLANRTLHVVSAERGANLNFEKDPCQLRTSFTGVRQGCEFGRKVELRVLAGREVIDGKTHLVGVQTEVRHHRPRRSDLTLRHAAVGLGEMPHHPEGRAEETLADGGQGGASLEARVFLRAAELLIELVPQEYAQGCAKGPQGEQSQGRADHFARPLHHHCYSTKPPPASRHLPSHRSAARYRHVANRLPYCLARPRKNPRRQGARHLRHRLGLAAHRDHRPAVGVRCGAAGSDSGQGPGVEPDFQFLVRADPDDRAESPAGAGARGGRQRSRGARPTAGPGRDRAQAVGAADRGRGAGLSDRFGLEGLSKDGGLLRHCSASRSAAGGPVAATPVHSGDQGGHRRA